METGQRGYLLTADETFLQPYSEATSKLPGLWDRLERGASEIEKDSDREHDLPGLVRDMKGKAERWQAEAAEPQIEMVRAGQFQAGISEEAVRASKELFDDFRASAGRVEEHLNMHIGKYAEDAERIGTWRTGLHMGLGLLALGSAIFAMVVARREHGLGQEAARVAEAERNRLQTILENLPVVVRLLSVPDGGVVIQNRAAEALFPMETWNSMTREERVAYYHFRKSDGSPLVPSETPLFRTMNSGETVRDYEVQMSSAEAGTRVMLSSTAPLRDEKGRISAVLVVLQDVTAMKELDQRKDEFIATAAHELRSPLTIISGYQQLLQRQMAGADAPTKVRGYLAALGAQVARLNALVEHILDASRIQLGRLMLEKTRFDLVEVARSIAGSVTEAGEVQAVNVSAPGGPVEGEWDMTRVEQVLANMVDNAVRHSPPETAVEIVVEARGKEAYVRVIDRGTGVPEEQRATLFDRYSQGSQAASPLSQEPVAAQRRRGGLGLGLYLSSEIVHAHGGRIGMEPNPEGGSVFWFTLPVG
jgi:signal transduction histidine kinase